MRGSGVRISSPAPISLRSLRPLPAGRFLLGGAVRRHDPDRIMQDGFPRLAQRLRCLASSSGQFILIRDYSSGYASMKPLVSCSTILAGVVLPRWSAVQSATQIRPRRSYSNRPFRPLAHETPAEAQAMLKPAAPELALLPRVVNRLDETSGDSIASLSGASSDVVPPSIARSWLNRPCVYAPARQCSSRYAWFRRPGHRRRHDRSMWMKTRSCGCSFACRAFKRTSGTPVPIAGLPNTIQHVFWIICRAGRSIGSFDQFVARSARRNSGTRRSTASAVACLNPYFRVSSR